MSDKCHLKCSPSKENLLIKYGKGSLVEGSVAEFLSPLNTRIKNIEDRFSKGFIDANANSFPKPLPTTLFKPNMIVRVTWFALDGDGRYSNSGRSTIAYLPDGSGRIVENLNDSSEKTLSLSFAQDAKTVQFNNESQYFARFRYSFELIHT